MTTINQDYAAALARITELERAIVEAEREITSDSQGPLGIVYAVSDILGRLEIDETKYPAAEEE
jgi:hypothetical protein